jgi:hypothetical protein
VRTQKMVFLLAGLAIAPPIYAQRVYWTDTLGGHIWRAHLNGSNPGPIVLNLSNPRGIAFEPVTRTVYWADLGSHKIQRADFDGSNVEDLIEMAGGPTSVAVDSISGKLYWTSGATIQRANLDGSDVETLIGPRPGSLWDLSLDLDAGMAYWAMHGQEYSRIERAPLDGSLVEDVSGPWAGPVLGLSLNTQAGKKYFSPLGLILRSDFGGGNFEILATGTSAYGIALDVPNGKMYVAVGANIRRADLNATMPETVVTGLFAAFDIALDLTCCRLYGDVAPLVSPPGDCAVDVSDILCLVDGFADLMLCPGSDLYPCGGDGNVDVGDILAGLDAFSGTYLCPPPCPK